MTEGAVFVAIAAALWEHAPEKIEGGSPARAQWLGDVLAVQMVAHRLGVGEVFVRAMNGEEQVLDDGDPEGERRFLIPINPDPMTRRLKAEKGGGRAPAR